MLLVASSVICTNEVIRLHQEGQDRQLFALERSRRGARMTRRSARASRSGPQHSRVIPPRGNAHDERRDDKVEARVPIVSTRIEQAPWFISWIDLHGLSDAFGEIAPKARQRETIQILGPTAGQWDDIL